jgi:hypothetical protein
MAVPELGVLDERMASTPWARRDRGHGAQNCKRPADVCGTRSCRPSCWCCPLSWGAAMCCGMIRCSSRRSQGHFDARIGRVAFRHRRACWRASDCSPGWCRGQQHVPRCSRERARRHEKRITLEEDAPDHDVTGGKTMVIPRRAWGRELLGSLTEEPPRSGWPRALRRCRATRRRSERRRP